jgi:hypothetical protein
MKGFLLSFRSEFYKTRKTLGFWSAILLPFLICLLVTVGFYTKSSELEKMSGQELWMRYSTVSLAIMGSLLLPIYTIFIAYSVSSIEHKADTWKTIFSLPISRWSVYSAKYLYGLFLVLLCLGLFCLFTIGFGNLLSALKPQLKFDTYHIEKELIQIYFKLFLSALGIFSIQFLLSLLWADFLKPMGLGFVATVSGVILAGNDWKYSYLFPYAHPMGAIRTMVKHSKGAANPLEIDIYTKDVYVSLIIAVVVFIAGYYIVQRKSVK